VQEPAVIKVNTPPEVIVQTPVVVGVKVTVKPDVALANPEMYGVVPKVCVPGGLKVMVCNAFGVTELEGSDAAPEPLAFLAVTVKVYGVPFVSPVTTSGLAAPVLVKPPGLDVTV
jgi:hypothetical protein